MNDTNGIEGSVVLSGRWLFNIESSKDNIPIVKSQNLREKSIRFKPCEKILENADN